MLVTVTKKLVSGLTEKCTERCKENNDATKCTCECSVDRIADIVLGTKDDRFYKKKMSLNGFKRKMDAYLKILDCKHRDYSVLDSYVLSSLGYKIITNNRGKEYLLVSTEMRLRNECFRKDRSGFGWGLQKCVRIRLAKEILAFRNEISFGEFKLLFKKFNLTLTMRSSGHYDEDYFDLMGEYVLRHYEQEIREEGGEKILYIVKKKVDTTRENLQAKIAQKLGLTVVIHGDNTLRVSFESLEDLKRTFGV